jgi:transcriptional regulator NrdR family protein
MAERMPGDDARGIVCRRCGYRRFRVTHTEPLAGGLVRRRKRCRRCGQKQVTFEGTPAALRGQAD